MKKILVCIGLFLCTASMAWAHVAERQPSVVTQDQADWEDEEFITYNVVVVNKATDETVYDDYICVKEGDFVSIYATLFTLFGYSLETDYDVYINEDYRFVDCEYAIKH